MDLAAKDSYIQKLVSKVFSQQDQEPRKRPIVQRAQSDTGPPNKKKKKCKKKHSKEKVNERNQPSKPQQKPSPAAQKSPSAGIQNGAKADGVNRAAQTPAGGSVKSSFSTVDVLRKRLHEKIEEARGQGAPKDPSSEAVQAKRAKRKLERERKKRKKKEFRLKQLAEASGQVQEPEAKPVEVPAPPAKKRDETAIVFNKVEMVGEEYVNKMVKKKNKKERVKGQLTPLTGKNYKQLLSRVEARKAKVEQLREKDEKKAQELEEKMKWTNSLYKAEGLKIKDNEEMLRSALKRKEKGKAQRKKHWNERSENVIEKMQQRQDKRKKNIQRQKVAKAEKKKAKARKKGRILPEDLKKAAL